ncbi:MAG: TonB-dependent receptor [Lentisphaerae bacterium]|nr:TonB-dependent receptor [Lentisphaerota bacterium]
MNLKWQRVEAVVIGMLMSSSMVLQAAVLSNDVVEVRARRLIMPGRSDSVVASLERDPRVALNRQGGTDVQSDISIRGSSFSEAGLILEGMALRNPQTEHFNAELPLPSVIFADPVVATGMEQVERGTTHPAGGIAVVSQDPRSGGYIDLGLGQQGSAWQAGWIERLLQESDEGRIGVGGFGYHEEATAVDYPDNDMERAGGGATFKSRQGPWSSDLMVGASHKEFGARGYYGVSPKWAALEDVDDVMVLGVVRRGDLDGPYRRVTGLWRSLEDHYLLFIDPAKPFENRHRSRMSGVTVDGREELNETWSWLWRAAFSYEGVNGALGEHDRERNTVLLMPRWQGDDLRVSAGVTGEIFSDGDGVVLPHVGVEWQVGRHQELFASYTEAMHEPSYTELNYDSPGSLGNAGLEKGRSRKSECGWRSQPTRGPATSVSLFHRETENAVDWIKLTEETARWTATDLGTVSTWGVECSAAQRLGENFRLRTGYTWIEKEHDWDVYASRYVLDYAQHRLSLDLDWQLAESWRLSVGQTLYHHSETEAREADASGVDGRLALQWYAPRPDGMVVRIGVDNLWNDSFGSYVDLPAPDRRVWAAASWRFF